MTTSSSEENNITPVAPQVNVASTASLKGIFGKKSASKKKFKTTNLNSDRQKAETKKKEEDCKREAAALARRAAQLEQEREEAAARGEIDLDGAEGWYRSMQVFEKKCAEAGLRIREVHNDGNCMFRSFVDQLGYDADGPKDYKNARKAAVQYIRRNESTFEPFMEPGVTTAVYTQRMQNDKVWGGNIELQALAQHYRVNVVVLQLSQHAYEASELQMIEMKNFDDSAPCVVLSYHDGLHYNSVRLADDKKKMTTNILHYEDIRKLGHDGWSMIVTNVVEMYLSKPDDSSIPAMHSSSHKFILNSDPIELRHWTPLLLREEVDHHHLRITLTLSTDTDHLGVALMGFQQFTLSIDAFRTTEVELLNEAGIIATIEICTAVFPRDVKFITPLEQEESLLGSLLPLEDPQVANIMSTFERSAAQERRMSAIEIAVDFLGGLEVEMGGGAESFAHSEGFAMVDELLEEEEEEKDSDVISSEESIFEDAEILGCAQDFLPEKRVVDPDDVPQANEEDSKLAEETPPEIELKDSPTSKREVVDKSIHDDELKISFAQRTAKLKKLVDMRRRRPSVGVQVGYLMLARSL
ncbi:hypothetical protein Pmar_PMAR009430 [Perkinsus marinus ATCC 50983]|uniref:OTU domain-containing protein n=1 Tax=Perkinsus marinus (strain ATCC 50983 / TXsc) TaxID=423536 RepID=C5KL27_PERM5|nr:hypothetical protein Pmar_PMAR009430 [Perkinsus marinus ATCC 50983]EER14835.1 hypothetical protein Pmar_PMAR009430 [Perkinsus marinus ATCC 50983]|eukprot:XP_002783039.1 hypothetical protein Pmar_PMAR009430 [Perkinsus marinus ATCC 50983]